MTKDKAKLKFFSIHDGDWETCVGTIWAEVDDKGEFTFRFEGDLERTKEVMNRTGEPVLSFKAARKDDNAKVN